MKFVIGGAFQGKLEFGFSLLGKDLSGVNPLNETIRELYADGRIDSYEEALVRPVVYGFHEYIRRLLIEGDSPEIFTKRLLENNKGAVVIADEIGYGIVPMDAFQRIYRETDGTVCQMIAKEAEAVYRVTCGIGTLIKG